jgi:hypothetical protein
LRGTKPDMPEYRVHDARSGFLEKSQLQKLRLRAMRAGVWFWSLPKIDRVVVDLTIMHGGFQSFIAMFALFEILLRRKKQWRKNGAHWQSDAGC